MRAAASELGNASRASANEQVDENNNNDESASGDANTQPAVEPNHAPVQEVKLKYYKSL